MVYLNLNDKKSINDVSLLGTCLVTPEIAKSLLEKNPSNRKLNDKRVSSYAFDMGSDSWDSTPTGLAITIDKDNNLIDGQHRLSAIVKSGKTIEMFLFQKNVSVEAKNVICDNGFCRNNSFLTGLSSNLTSSISSIIKLCSNNQGDYVFRVTPSQIESFMSKLSENEIKITHIIGDSNKKGLSAYVRAAFIMYYIATHNHNTLTVWNNLKERVLVKDSIEYITNIFIENITGYGCVKDKNLFTGVYSRLKGLKRTSTEPKAIIEEVKSVYKSVMARTSTTEDAPALEKEPAFALF